MGLLKNTSEDKTIVPAPHVNVASLSVNIRPLPRTNWEFAGPVVRPSALVRLAFVMILSGVGLGMSISTGLAESPHELGESTPSDPDTTAISVLENTLKHVDNLTNFTAAVDLNLLVRRTSQVPSTVVKETWRFNRLGRTNQFLRRRFLPFPGREIMETGTYSGGWLIANTNIHLPDSISLPGFEPVNFLRELRASKRLDVSQGDKGSHVLNGTSSDGAQLTAWFFSSGGMPFRLERRRDNQLLLVYSCTHSSSGGFLLPQRDTIHFYEAGQVKETVIRAYTNVQENYAAADEFTAPRIPSSEAQP